ncbi:MAG: choice-of-anchor E domain-containing protein [Phycisphaerales bacterium]|nr:choice-of-anchor E domain-containing protein [Phycisphaerae bacterium]NNF41563.1 choice-of-anchor E domain-containing protein [Phycisphaerales bacterium]NNM26248.1 choice-of-anchor E domain-containing protein [Phycisphaerales bacterium]
MTRARVGVAILLATALAPAAMAGLDQETQNESFGFPLSPGAAVISFDKFDDLGGLRVLEQVTMRLDGFIGAEVTAENDSVIPAPDFGVSIGGFMSINFDSLAAALGFDRTFLTDGSVTPSDGVQGSGTDFWDFGTVSDSGFETDSTTTGLSAFVGPGTIDANISAAGGFSVVGSTDSTMVLNNFRAEGTVSVLYEYSVVPGPGAAAFLMLGGGIGLGRRRRRSA